MKRKQGSAPEPAACGRAVANLLRLADDDLRDARLLMEQNSPRNAALLQKAAVAHMVEATLAFERGWPTGAGTIEAVRIDGANPARTTLRALEASAAERAHPLPDGRLPQAPGEGALRASIDAAGSLLPDLVRRLKPVAEGGGAAAATVQAAGRRSPPPAASRRAAGIAAAAAGGPPGRFTQTGAARPSRVPGKLASVSSASFWLLMDRWGVQDLDALALLGHAGGLTKTATRPRFKLNQAETDMVIHLQEVDAALVSLGLDPSRWLQAPLAADPLLGATPLDFMRQQRSPGVQRLHRYIVQLGLRRSLG